MWISGSLSSLVGGETGSTALGALLSIVGTLLLLVGIYNALQNLEELHRMVTRRYFSSGDAASAQVERTQP